MAEGSVITEKGRALLGKILATNSTLNITGAQIGSGDLPAGTPPASMTALASYVMDATIVAISTPAAGEVKVVLQVRPTTWKRRFLPRKLRCWRLIPTRAMWSIATSPCRTIPCRCVRPEMWSASC